EAYKPGEWFKFKVRYMAFNVSYAELSVNEKSLHGKKVNHVVGTGKSTGLLRLFYKVDDRYESFIDPNTDQPYRFIRKIDEGGHTKDIEINFNYKNKQAYVDNFKYNKRDTIPLKPGAQDMISAFYFLRNQVDPTSISVGDTFQLPMYLDEDSFEFKLEYVADDVLKTKFGKIQCMIFKPYVMEGRVFKEKEGLSVWISKDRNKIPIKVKANLAVGSLTAELDQFKGLKHSFKILVD
ncbi:MAG: DUF3108 domain-containing protein, partial [Flavobacteriaceae bacterium]|nr:DUF3108 domain-containing protein [Flavobacteriaceae bacterium]